MTLLSSHSVNWPPPEVGTIVRTKMGMDAGAALRVAMDESDALRLALSRAAAATETLRASDAAAFDAERRSLQQALSTVRART